MPDNKTFLQKAFLTWQTAVVEPLVSKFPERKKSFTTPTGIPIERLYTPANGDGEPYLEKLGFPGQYPFTRGVQPTMYRGRPWTMRQYAGFGGAAETNRRFHYLLDQGLTGLSVAFDLPTQMGYDPDHPLARGEVGRVGASIASLDDMRVLFEGIPLDRVSTSMTINSTAAILLAMYVALSQERAVAISTLQGTIQNDPLKEYIARGTYIFPPRPSLRITTDLIAYAHTHLPKFNPISISGYHIREAGATAVQEVAYTMAHAITYVQAALDAGLSIDDFAGQLSFFFASHNNFFEEVAKFRAARRLWARIMRERFNAASDRFCALRFHTQTCGCTLTAQQPDNNIVRVTMQALAAVLGGTQSLHTNARDEALSLPTAEAALTALRTQQILAHESGVADTIDPLGGSYLVESLTDRIESEAVALIQRIDELGGAVRAIEQHVMQDAISENAYRYQKAIESGEQLVVGVNTFSSEEPTVVPIHKPTPEIERESIERLQRTRARRDERAVKAALAAVADCARGSQNLFPPIVAVVKAGGTTGEISEVLRGVFGVYIDEG